MASWYHYSRTFCSFMRLDEQKVTRIQKAEGHMVKGILPGQYNLPKKREMRIDKISNVN